MPPKGEYPYLRPEPSDQPPGYTTQSPDDALARAGEFQERGQTRYCIFVYYQSPANRAMFTESLKLICQPVLTETHYLNGRSFTLRLTQEKGELWHVLLDNEDREPNPGRHWSSAFMLHFGDETGPLRAKELSQQTPKGVAVFFVHRKFESVVELNAHPSWIALRLWVPDVRVIWKDR